MIVFDCLWGLCVRCETKDGVTYVHTHIYIERKTDKCTNVCRKREIEGDESLQSIKHGYMLPLLCV